MNRSETVTCRSLRAVGSILLALFLFAAFAAPAQVITVTSADPPETEQGTLGLVVKIAGSNFGKDSKVDFLVSGTTNPGGVTVRSVKYRNPKSLEATIDVAPDAQTQNRFDIQVMSGGRTGKGTELFSVKVKTTGGDLTPPGDVTDLSVSEVGFNTAYLTWTAPANDGHDASSGPAAKYDLRVRKADCGPYTMEIWVDDTMTGIHNDPCHASYYRGNAGAPGTQEIARVGYLAPGTEYYAAIRTVDDSQQGPNWSPLPDAASQLRFVAGPYPPTGSSAPWTPQIVDACPVVGTACKIWAPPRLDFDAQGHPAIFYLKHYTPTLATWTGAEWTFEQPPITVDTGNWLYDFAIDPWSGEATVSSVVPGTKAELRVYRRTPAGWTSETLASGTVGANAVGFAPGSPVATVAYLYTKGGTSLRVAERSGSTWKTETVASSVSGALSPSIAFDEAGNPAVTFAQDVGGRKRLAFAVRIGGSWQVELVGPDPGAPWNSLNDSRVVLDPSRSGFAAVGRYYDANTYSSRIELCERTSGGWACGTVVEGQSLGGLTLAIDQQGAAFVSYMKFPDFRMLVREPGSAGWVAEHIDWNVWSAPPGDLRIGPDGVPVLAYGTAHDETHCGGSDYNRSLSLARRDAATGGN